MRHTKAVLALTAAAALLVGSCSEEPAAPEEGLQPASAPGSSVCPLVGDIAKDAQSFLSNPYRNAARGYIQTMGSACADGNQATTKANALLALKEVGKAVNAGAFDGPVVGSRLVGGLLACAEALCSSTAVPAVDFAGAIELGFFGIRDAGTDPVVSREPVVFTDWEGTQRRAFIGVEIASGEVDWPRVIAPEDYVILYGDAYEGDVNGLDRRLGNLRFNVGAIPDDSGDFLDDHVRFGVCFEPTNPLPIPHEVAANEGTPHRVPAIVRDDRVTLESGDPDFCSDVVFPTQQAASIFGSVTAAIANLLPDRLRIFFFGDRSTTAVGGTAGDVPPLGVAAFDGSAAAAADVIQGAFSTFEPVGANAKGRLVLLGTVPASGTSMQPLSPPINVQALDGDGVPAELVLVSWSIIRNSGVPAGAEIDGTTEVFTAELEGGINGVAVFANLRLNKAGNYVICASGTRPGFEPFAQVCTGIIHIGN